MKKNTIKEEVSKEIDNLDEKGLLQKYQEAQNQIKMIKLIADECKNRLKEKLGDNDFIDIDNGHGVYWQYRNKYEVSMIDAEQILDDQDMLYTISKIDLTLAKKTLDKELYKELENKKQSVGEIKALCVGKLNI